MADVNVISHIGVCQIQRLFNVLHQGMQTSGNVRFHQRQLQWKSKEIMIEI